MYTVHGPEIFGALKTTKFIKKVFKQSFYGENWANAVPFPGDDIYWVTNDKDEIVSFCMIHEDPPYTFTKPGWYLYNLCTTPKHRNKGVATLLIDYVKYRVKVIHCHHNSKNKRGHAWFLNRGFIAQNSWREIYREYTWPANAANQEFVQTPVDMSTLTKEVCPYYDSEENLFYLNR